MKGLPVDETADFEWMLETPDEFELRVLVRHFDEREALLERFGRFELDPGSQLSDERLSELVAQYVEGQRRVARMVGLDLPWVHSTAELDAVVAPAGVKTAEGHTDTGRVRTNLFDWTLSEPCAVGGSALSEVAAGRGEGTLAVFHLIAPLFSSELDFCAFVEIYKSGRDLWIVDNQVVVTEPTVRERWLETPGWQPELDWPTDADIVEHQENALVVRQRWRIARNAETAANSLARLSQDESDAVRSAVAANPSTPAGVLAELSADPAPRVLAALIRSTDPSAVLIRQALTHPASEVRASLAGRQDLTSDMIETLAADPSPKVLRSVRQNPTTPAHIQEGLQG